MKEKHKGRQNSNALNIKLKLAFINFIILGAFLFFSEFLNAVFNNTLDRQGADFAVRLGFTFKTTVVLLYLVFASILYTIVLSYLRPLFNWIKTGKSYLKARTAAIRIPWTILVFQIGAWTLGTTVYYAIHNFQAESGIPYVFGLLLKIAVGLMAGMYSAILINIILIPVKGLLGIRDIKTGEDDGFSRRRDTLVVLFSSLYIVITFAYIVYYYANRGVPAEGLDFYLPLFSLCLTSMGISVGLMGLARHEYKVQIRSINAVVKALSEESSDPEKRINIINFNELGEIGAYVNTILDNFKILLNEIQGTSRNIAESTSRVSASAQQNAAYANQQAAAATEVVSTMEDVDVLSKEVGMKIREVADQSVSVKEHVQNGVSAIQQNLAQMDQVKVSYAQTIEGIRNLGEHISGIWEIVKIINAIAGQIKIIAFNAALEASSAGEAGKNFEIVAAEIRRLADNTVDSTREIKLRISEIEEASDNLIRLSEEDSEKIKTAWEMSQSVEGLFSRIRDASEVSAASAGEIQGSVSKQVNAFEQILLTLRQISEGISDFTRTIDENSDTAHALEETAKVLNGIIVRYGTQNAAPAEGEEA